MLVGPAALTKRIKSICWRAPARCSQAAPLWEGGALHRVRAIHLLAVTAIVGENGSTEDEVVAALLYNVPEDQGSKARLKDSGTLRESSREARRLRDRNLRGVETLMATAQGDLRGAHQDNASLCAAARPRSIQAAQRPAQSLRTYALWATTYGTTPRAAMRALWHYRALIET
jgi:hypothetical protein